MCKMKTPTLPASPVAALIAAPDNRESIQQGQIEARLRRARSGAAANVLTGALGIPMTRRMGEVSA